MMREGGNIVHLANTLSIFFHVMKIFGDTWILKLASIKVSIVILFIPL